jgi:septum site-determining protein MinC
MMSSDLIVIKGGKDGLRLQLDETASWPAVLDALRARLSQGSAFLHGASLTLDLGIRQVAPDDLAAAVQLLREHGLQPATVAASNRESRQAARTAGLPSRALARPPESVATNDTALCLRRTIRSGQIIRHPGDVTVIGDVNAGGEVIAGGSVVVWGRIRGLVHAGAMGDTSAVICALELVPMQLRIADRIARSPEGGHERLPEVAHIVDDGILVEAWQVFRR